MTRRPGPQRIPRPASARPGAPPPWAALPPSARSVAFDTALDRIHNRGPGRIIKDSRADVRPADARSSAVLVALYDADGPHVILTRRASHLRSHRHEVSFPGGREESDDRHLWQTALRETWEEIALPPEAVTPVGELDGFVTVGSNALVHPYVGRLERPPRGLRAEPGEVEQIIHVSLAELAADGVFREELWEFGGIDRPVYFFDLDGDTVWGATGAMLRQLVGIVTGTDDTIGR